jgi:hypothetical protein
MRQKLDARYDRRPDCQISTDRVTEKVSMELATKFSGICRRADQPTYIASRSSISAPDVTDVSTKGLSGENAMKALLGSLTCFVIVMCVSMLTQSMMAQTVAYVYVSSQLSSSSHQIDAYAANSDGRLTLVPGSPFAENVSTLAANSKYLFGADGTFIYTYSIASNGALTEASSIDAQQYNDPNGTGGPYYLFLDHTGATLYDVDIYGNNAANNDFQFFDIDKSGGALTYFGASDATIQYWTPLRFIGNNKYAYGADWVHLNNDIYGYQRDSNGALTHLNINPTIPSNPPSATNIPSFYVSYLAEADPTNNVAISLTPVNINTWQIDGPPQIAVYTADTSGNLTTHSTYENMPISAVGYVQDMAMSPSGKILAVGGNLGLQLFHFNGSDPATKFTGLLITNPVSSDDQMFWDNANHLFVISSSTNSLHVFTITPTSVKQAPGSPYTITNPVNLAVLPRS